MFVGSNYIGEGICKFSLWSPTSNRVDLQLISPEKKVLNLEKKEFGYFQIEAKGIYPGAKYFYKLDDDDDEFYPDPASHRQPEGVHGPSEVVDHLSYNWNDKEWKGKQLKDLIIYELHVGTFTPEGTFEGVIKKLEDLVELGINAIELMPLNQFPGSRNWGYDGAYLYAVQNSYGKPDDLRKLVDECHRRDIVVILDVVYNHLGPEGNYLSKFGPYFTSKYATPWGDAINFDDEYSDGVRDFFSDNAIYWFENFHIDGLRLDATHMVFDNGAIHFWQYLSQKTQQYSAEKNKHYFFIAESDLNSLRPISKIESGGFGFDGQWLDDFHHALYVLLDPKGKQYYSDFGKIEQLTKALKDGFVHSGEWVEFRKRKHGMSSAGVSGDHFIVFSQNHDQIGNRMLGERNSVLMSFDGLKLAAAIVLLSPNVPMIFMGEEYGEENPFLYFISHLDDALVDAVRKGRKDDFAKYNFDGNPPDPQSEETFNSSKLQWDLKDKGKHKVLWNWYRELIRIRKTTPALCEFNKGKIDVKIEKNNLISTYRRGVKESVYCLFNLSGEEEKADLAEIGSIKLILDSAESQWKGMNISSDLYSASTSRPLAHVAPWGVKVFLID